jgi:membrane-associated phospholipid phosphatase
MWNVISNLGDAALTLPLALACGLWVGISNWRVAARWILLLGGGMLLVGTTKILYAGCGVELRPINFRMISGHTMMSSCVWAVAFMLLCQGRRAGPIGLGLCAGLLLGAAIGTARVFENAHTVSEVIAGWALGSALALCFARICAKAMMTPRRPLAAGTVLLMMSTVAYGHHAPFQTAIERYSPWLCHRTLS